MMPDRILKPVPITAERFAPFGEVIRAGAGARGSMNEARFDRYDDLARIDIDTAGDGRTGVSIVRSRAATTLPYRFDLVERHPLGSQAFVPLAAFRFVVVVAEPGESVEAEDLHAFVTSGREGINYRRGTWHMPLIALAAGQEFLVIDRAGSAANCEERVLGEAVVLQAP
ncbi:MAG: ureidoglycolate lyase [Woeseiaceae bacterium]|nr:ureidoglycolate lyase [Woeseiaceae bacterium]